MVIKMIWSTGIEPRQDTHKQLVSEISITAKEFARRLHH